MAKQTNYNPVKNTEQDIANLGLDRDFNIPMRENLVYQSSTDTLERMTQPITSESACSISTSGNSKTRLVDLHGHEVNVQAITGTLAGDEYGAVTISIIHGLDPHGEWKDVKVSHSGALAVETTTGTMCTRVDTASSTVTYIGIAQVGSLDSQAVWQIKKLDTSGIALSTTFADGNANEDNIWTNRSSLSYS